MRYSRHAKVVWIFGTPETAERTALAHTPAAEGSTVFNITKTIDSPNNGYTMLTIEYDYIVKGNARYDIKRFAYEAVQRANTVPVIGPTFEISERKPVAG